MMLVGQSNQLLLMLKNIVNCQYVTHRIQNFCIRDVMCVTDNICFQTVKDTSLQGCCHFTQETLLEIANR